MVTRAPRVDVRSVPGDVLRGGATIEATSTSSTWGDTNEIGRPCARAVMRTCRAEGHGLPMGLSPVHAVSARQRKSSCRRRFLVSERRREAP